MAVLSADLYIEPIVGSGAIVQIPLTGAADIVYRGALVYLDAVAGGCFVAGYAANDMILGYSPKKQTIAATGDPVEIVIGGACWFPAITGIAVTDTGQTLNMDVAGLTDNIDDSDTEAGNNVAATDCRVGKVLRYTATRTLVLVDANARLSVGTKGSWD